MTPVELSFDWGDVDQAVASKALARNFNPKWWISLALFLGGLVVAVLFDLKLFNGKGLGGMFGFLIGTYACIGWNALRYRKMTAGIRNSPARQGGVTLLLDRDGFRSRTPLTESWMAWSTITAIKPTKGMIVLAIGDVEYLPILDNCLPNDLNRDAMVSLLEGLTGLTA
jgi:hypothetical protein